MAKLGTTAEFRHAVQADFVLSVSATFLLFIFLYYRDIFESHYADQGHIIPEFWMPRFVDAKDPSARTLRVYYEENVELRERSL